MAHCAHCVVEYRGNRVKKSGMAARSTPLARSLRKGDGVEPASPLTAFRMATQWWLEGRKLNLSALAGELGVSRATLMRWVGSRELLLGEVLWSMVQSTLAAIAAQARERHHLVGVEYLAYVYHNFGRALVNFLPLRRFLDQDPRFAMQVLTSNVSGLSERTVALWESMLREEIEAGRISPQMDTHNLASFSIRIGESAIYSNLICGHPPELESAETALRLLLTARA